VTNGALPAGVTLSRTGQLVGTPTEAGVFDFEVTLYENYSGSGSINFDCLMVEEEDDCSVSEDQTDIYDESELKTDAEWFEMVVAE